jgi:hypothetical protein
VSDPLVTYLEDQKAGAALAIDLLKAMKARHDDGTQVIVLVDIFFLLLNKPGCPEHHRFNRGVDHERLISII